jgi:hypothetical protein
VYEEVQDGSVRTWLSEFQTPGELEAWAERYRYVPTAGVIRELAKYFDETKRQHDQSGPRRIDYELMLARKKDKPPRLIIYKHAFIKDTDGKWFERTEMGREFYPRHLNPPPATS